jgi:hypothetical protein
MNIKMSLTTEAIDSVISSNLDTSRVAEIYHRVIGQFYQREVDSQAGMAMMFSDSSKVDEEYISLLKSNEET